MSPSGENPFAGAANIRGALLIAVAVILGVVLLGKGFDSGFIGSSGGDPSDEAAGSDDGEEGENGEEGGAVTTTTATPTTHAPAEVRVLVLNSTGPSGSARTASDLISAGTFVTLEPDNATDRTATATAVFAQAGYEADAAAVAALAGITTAPVAMPTPPPPPAPADANVVIVLGPDYAPPG